MTTTLLFPRIRTGFVRRLALVLLAGGFVLCTGRGAPTPAPKRTDPSPWAAWVEPDFPFFSSILDARKAGPGLPTNNLTPRGLVLNLGRDCWVCFDTDLLRVSAIWRGKGVTAMELAAGSYHDPFRKTPGGQFPAPEPDGKVWLANGIYSGWQTGAQLSLDDPREPAPSPGEVGRGPIPEAMGRFEAVRLVRDGAVLEYTAGGSRVREWVSVAEQSGQAVVERHFRVEPARTPLLLALGFKTGETTIALGGLSVPGAAELFEAQAVSAVRVPAHTAPVEFSVAFTVGATVPAVTARALPTAAPARRWPQQAVSKVAPSTEKGAYVVDHVALPADNPWRRAVRIADIQFLKDGTGVGVTVDGDVWLIRGLHETGGTVRWNRFASGLHEPMSVAIRDDEIFAFDRNGIWRLRDTNGDGEADVHELFSNAFAQTADMREFPTLIRLAPGGEFVIAKGGQEATTLGKHNGSVLRISADGRRATLLGYGFRQPNIGVNIRTGLVTGSDQEGQYIPSTPLHILRDGQFYGFLSDLRPREQYPAPIAEPLTWLPHAVNSSAESQVWLFDAKMGPLNDALIHIGFNKPEVFRVLLNERGARLQAAVVSVTSAFDFTPLNGSVNPADGQFYLAGFQVIGWGNSIDTLAGLGRVRYTGAPVTLPREVAAMDQGFLLRFDVALDPATATDPANYSLAMWNYRRTYRYGSPQLKADGTPGQDWLMPSSAYLSRDRRSVFVGVPGMKTVMQMRFGWALATAEGMKFSENAYLTPYELTKFDPRAEGFDEFKVDLTPRAAVAQARGPVSVEEGRRLSQVLGCVACHSPEGMDIFHVGPTWKGLFGSERPIVTGPKQTRKHRVDEAYLRESILEPSAKVVSGFERGEYAMPSYAGVVNESQLESLVLYIKSLR